MQSIHSILSKLKNDYTDINFKENDLFAWSPKDKTVSYNLLNNEWEKLFHEVGHALIGHIDYTHDINLLTCERDAWEKAKKIAHIYNYEISDQIIESQLDTYRQWLHARSTCPSCQSTGLQMNSKKYSCITCGQTWRVNEAKVCSLRRYKIKQ